MDLTWVPGVVTALVVSGAQHILFTGKALQRLEDMGARMAKVELTKVDRELHDAMCLGQVKSIDYESRRIDGEIHRLDGRLDVVAKETDINRERYHTLNNLVQGKLK